MGAYLNIHIGAGIKIPTQKEKYIAKEFSCGSHTHFNNDNKFCGKCGQEIKVIEVEKEACIWVSDLIGSENLTGHFEEDYIDTYIFSNFGHGSIKVEEDKPIKINANLIDATIAEFKAKHEKDIAILEKRIGFSVNVEFFFLYEYS
jgi:hypothetical protein